MIKAILSMGSNVTPINFNVTKRNQRMRFKKAQVIPVHKKVHKTHVKNYGPISLLSMMSKILEKIVYKKLFSFFLYCSYLSSIHEKANCIAILWTGSPHSLGSCHF